MTFAIDVAGEAITFIYFSDDVYLVLYKQWNGKVGELTYSRFLEYKQSRGLLSNNQTIEVMVLEAFSLESADKIADEEFPSPPRPFALPLGGKRVILNFRTNLSIYNAYQTIQQAYGLHNFQHFIDLLLAFIQGPTSEEIIDSLAAQNRLLRRRTSFDLNDGPLNYTHRTINAKLKLINRHPSIIPIFYDELFNLNIPTPNRILVYQAHLDDVFKELNNQFHESLKSLKSSPEPSWLKDEILQDTKDQLRDTPYSLRQLQEFKTRLQFQKPLNLVVKDPVEVGKKCSTEHGSDVTTSST